MRRTYNAVFNIALRSLLHAQLHLVHWNEDLYDSFEEAVKREDGIVIITVFIKVLFCHCVYLIIFGWQRHSR